MFPLMSLPLMSHPSRDVWIEIYDAQVMAAEAKSHPSRDVWIEIDIAVSHFQQVGVTSLTGCVD